MVGDLCSFFHFVRIGGEKRCSPYSTIRSQQVVGSELIQRRVRLETIDIFSVLKVRSQWRRVFVHSKTTKKSRSHFHFIFWIILAKIRAKIQKDKTKHTANSLPYFKFHSWIVKLSRVHFNCLGILCTKEKEERKHDFTRLRVTYAHVCVCLWVWVCVPLYATYVSFSVVHEPMSMER